MNNRLDQSTGVKRKTEAITSVAPVTPQTSAGRPSSVSTSGSSSGGGPVAVTPEVAMSRAMQNCVQQFQKQPPAVKVSPAREVVFTGNVLPLPAALKAVYPPKTSMAAYSSASHASLPCLELFNQAWALSCLTGKSIVSDYWCESLMREQKIMVVEIKDDTGRSNFILMKNRHEFTSPIKEYHEICYFIPGPADKDGKPSRQGACGYLFLTQNSIYCVKYPVKVGQMTSAEFDKLNREIDAAGY